MSNCFQCLNFCTRVKREDENMYNNNRNIQELSRTKKFSGGEERKGRNQDSKHTPLPTPHRPDLLYHAGYLLHSRYASRAVSHLSRRPNFSLASVITSPSHTVRHTHTLSLSSLFLSLALSLSCSRSRYTSVWSCMVVGVTPSSDIFRYSEVAADKGREGKKSAEKGDEM